jgi:hypothetical protein
MNTDDTDGKEFPRAKRAPIRPQWVLADDLQVDE